MTPISSNKLAGFALIELLIVIAIIGTLSSILFFSFNSSATNKTARNQTISIIISDIRRAQTMATSGVKINTVNVCGFGIHYLSPSSYRIYAGGEANCATADRNYQSGSDINIQDITLSNYNMNLKGVFSDIFFEPPDPKTFINNYSLLSGPVSLTTTTISIGGKSVSCGGGNCTNITIKTSGGIDINEN